MGTPVLTPTGEVAIEELRPGDLVIAVSGSSAPFQAVIEVRHSTAREAMVLIRAGALDDGAPQQDLHLAPGHAVLIDGTLFRAIDLVDGHGIVIDHDGAPGGLVHLVLAGHDAVLAAGAAVESVLPHPDAPPCAPRRQPDGTFRALQSWRAEAMGWRAPTAAKPQAPVVGTLRDRLRASPFGPLVQPDLPLSDEK